MYLQHVLMILSTLVICKYHAIVSKLFIPLYPHNLIALSVQEIKPKQILYRTIIYWYILNHWQCMQSLILAFTTPLWLSLAPWLIELL